MYCFVGRGRGFARPDIRFLDRMNRIRQDSNPILNPVQSCQSCLKVFSSDPITRQMHCRASQSLDHDLQNNVMYEGSLPISLS